MAIKWTKTLYYEGLAQFDAKVGHLFVRAQDNGEGRFNWHVATSDMGICNEEDFSIEQGGEPSERKAKAAVRDAVKKIIGAMESDL